MRGEPRGGAQAVATTVPVQQAPATLNTAPKKPTITKPNEEEKKPASSSTSANKPGSAKPSAAVPPKKTVKGSASSEPKKMPEEPDLHQDTVEEKAVEIFGEECVKNLASSNWKDRLAAIETLVAAIKRMVPEDAPVQIIIRTLAKKPGFKDSHFQCLKQRLEVVSQVAEQGFKFSQRSASYCLNEIADKIGDVKTSQQAKDALSKIADQTTLPYVLQEISKPIIDGKNPKNQENFLIWLSQAIREFGFQKIELKPLIAQIKTSLQNTNPAVRVAAIQLIATLYMFVGPNFRSFFEQEKAALLEQIDAEIEKVKGEKPPVPIRGMNVLNVNSQSGGDGSGGAEEEDPVELQKKQEALFPRTDISGEFNETLMNQLNDKNWKERQAALERIEQILRDNKYIEPSLGDLPASLAKRLTDANKVNNKRNFLGIIS